MKLIENTDNPFVNIAITIANNKGQFDKSSFQIIDFLLQYEHQHNFDMNQQFLVHDNDYNGYNKSSTNYYTNFFNTIFNLENSFNPQLIDKLIHAGLKFNPFLINEKNEIVSDILFTKNDMPSNRNIFLFKLYIQQHGIHDFTEQIKKYNTLQRFVSKNEVSTIEFLLKHVSIDLTNNNLETPIMFSNNLETLKLLSTYHPNWGQKNIVGNDCSFFFSGIKDDSIKKDMLNFYLEQLSHHKDNFSYDHDYIQNRLEETLIQLVTKDATKIELQKFLKKHTINNAHQLTNKNNRTLGHICVHNEDFARFSLFPKTDLYHIDKNGYNIFTTLFSKTRFSSETKIKGAKSLLLSCLEQPEKNLSTETFNRLIEMPFIKYSSDCLPDWILKDSFLRQQILSVFNISFNDIDFKNYLHNSHITSEEKNEIFFDLLGSMMNQFDIYLLQDNHIINKIFDSRTYFGGCEYYFNEEESKKIMLLLNKCDNIGKINLDDFLEDKFSNINDILLEMKNTFIVNNSEIYESKEDLKIANDTKFFNDVCVPFFVFLTENKLFNIISQIKDNLVNESLHYQKEHELTDFLKIFTYLQLNQKLENKKIKNTNHKI